MNTPTPKAHVSRITVARLHNLGNYEHVRYEIAVEIPDGTSASKVLSDVERVLAGLDPKPPVDDYDLRRATEALKRPVEEWEDWERGNEPTYRSRIAADAEWRAAQKLARQALDDIGGTSVYTDAKDTWDN